MRQGSAPRGYMGIEMEAFGMDSSRGVWGCLKAAALGEVRVRAGRSGAKLGFGPPVAPVLWCWRSAPQPAVRNRWAAKPEPCEAPTLGLGLLSAANDVLFVNHRQIHVFHNLAVQGKTRPPKPTFSLAMPET